MTKSIKRMGLASLCLKSKILIIGIFGIGMIYQQPVYAADLLEIFERAGIIGILLPDAPNLFLEVRPEEKMYLLFLAIIRFILFIAGIGATIMIIIAGMRMIISAGNEGAVTAARRMVIYSVIGLLAVILSYFIVQNIIGILYDGD